MAACKSATRELYMVFLYAFAVFALVWSLAAIQLAPRVRNAGTLLAWVAGGLALATAACVVYGAYGIARYGDWLSISTAQALHTLLGEGSLAMRRSGWTALNRAAGIYLNANIGWTLLALCLVQFQSIGFWSRIAEARRTRRRRAARG